MLNHFLKNEKKTLLKLCYLVQYESEINEIKDENPVEYRKISEKIGSLNNFDEEIVNEMRILFESYKDFVEKRQIDEIFGSEEKLKEEKVYDVADFQDFIEIKPESDKIYKSLNKNNIPMDIIEEYDEYNSQKCLFCGQEVLNYKKHLEKCISTDLPEQNIEKNDKNDFIKVYIQLQDKDSTYTTSEHSVSKIKEEIAPIIKLAKSKIHIFDGDRPMKNNETVKSHKVFARLKK